MSAHTHDDIDWASRLSSMRRLETLEREALAAVAARLTAGLTRGATIVDVGCGAGGMSARLASALQDVGGGALILVDAVDELLDAARGAARAAGGSAVDVRTVVADAAAAEFSELVPSADLLWASAVVHHLPDQQRAVTRLASALAPGGVLALAEGGLDTRCLPWDLGIGTPGLEERLSAARGVWFERLRAGMADVVRMPYGWPTALRHAGLSNVDSFSYLLDHPAPAGETVREFAIERLGWLVELADDRIDEADRAVVRRLLDPADPEYLGGRDDVYLLNARSVHVGRRA